MTCFKFTFGPDTELSKLLHCYIEARWHKVDHLTIDRCDGVVTGHATCRCLWRLTLTEYVGTRLLWQMKARFVEKDSIFRSLDKNLFGWGWRNHETGEFNKNLFGLMKTTSLHILLFNKKINRDNVIVRRTWLKNSIKKEKRQVK